MSQGFLTKAQFKESVALHTAASIRSQLSEEGLQSELDAEFDAMDLNRDGMLTLEEYQRALSPADLKNSSPFSMATAEMLGV
jgi:Ca2+-binding EF-hand superfamily protein